MQRQRLQIAARPPGCAPAHLGHVCKGVVLSPHRRRHRVKRCKPFDAQVAVGPAQGLQVEMQHACDRGERCGSGRGSATAGAAWLGNWRPAAPPGPVAGIPSLLLLHWITARLPCFATLHHGCTAAARPGTPVPLCGRAGLADATAPALGSGASGDLSSSPGIAQCRTPGARGGIGALMRLIGDQILSRTTSVAWEVLGCFACLQYNRLHHAPAARQLRAPPRRAHAPAKLVGSTSCRAAPAATCCAAAVPLLPPAPGLYRAADRPSR